MCATCASPLLLNELAGLERDIVLVSTTTKRFGARRSIASWTSCSTTFPDELHMAIATRVDPPLSLARLRARGEMRRFGPPSSASRRRRPGSSCAVPSASTSPTIGLHAYTDARRAGRQVSTWPGSPCGATWTAREFIESFAGDDRHIVDYLASEVLSDQPDEVQDFLVHTSLLERLCGRSAMRSSASGSRPACWSESRDRTCSWSRWTRPGRGTAITVCSASSCGTSSNRRIVRCGGAPRRACAWHRQEGLIPDAIWHATAAGDFGEARDLISSYWNDYFNRGRLATVERWLEAIPVRAE